MPKITLSRETFERLQKHASPFVDSPDAVIARLLDAWETAQTPPSQRAAPPPAASGNLMHFDPEEPLPDLKHTQLLNAAISGEAIAPTNWNALLREMLTFSFAALGGDLEKLRRLCTVNLVPGQKSDDGYH